MIRFLFSHLDKSVFVENFALQKLEPMLARFRRDRALDGVVKLDMENSRMHAGRDSFACEIRIRSRMFKNIVIRKSNINLYQAIAQAADTLHAVLSKRHAARVKWHRRRQRCASLAEAIPA